MIMIKIPLSLIAYGRSGDKGSSSNIGIIAYTPYGYDYLVKNLTAGVVNDYFFKLNPISTLRYELPNLGALNFVLKGALGEGGSRSLRIDAQGKALGQALLQMVLDVEEEDLKAMLKN